MEDKVMPRILLVDDEKGLRTGTKRLLEAEGYTVETAENGSEGIRAGRSSEFDIAIVDLRMPDFDGIKVINEILAVFPNTVCYIATAYASYETAIEATKAGAYGYILKPFTPDELLKRIHEAYIRRLLLLETEKWKKEREERLLEVAFEKTRLNTIINSISDGVFVVNKNGETVLYNPALFRYINPGLIEIEKNSLDKIHPGIALLINKILKSDEVEKKSYSEQIELKEGGELFIEAASSAVRHPDGSLAGAVVTIKNITELKKIEHLKSQFVSMVSHELKAPLAAVYGYLKLLTDENYQIGKEQSTSYMNRSMLRLDSLLKMVNDLLDISRMELKTVKREIEPICLNEIVNAVLELFEPEVKKKNLHINKKFGETENEFRADREEMMRIFTNLVSNGIKYNRDNGDLTIDISETDGSIIAEVTDTGIGLKPSEIEKLFHEFYRAKNEFTKDISGTGLGLSIVKKIVESYGGKITVLSEFGKGTTFRLGFPLKENKKMVFEKISALS